MIAAVAKGTHPMSIRLLPFVVLVLWLGAQNSFAQAGDLDVALRADVVAIRADVAQINAKLSTYTKTERSVEAVEGGGATYYFRDKELKKIAARMYGETYNAAVSLYYKHGVLTFAYYRFNHYDMPISLAKPVKIVRIG